ncbi:MAG TPA: putative quinol monooxygenase [Steroidobacteraceae bacterium]|nr:putative quinol monooxygenase [Steroidobacteraceae bacterium]
MEVDIFGRFQVRPGAESAMEAAIRLVVDATRVEVDCIGIDAFRSTQDGTVFFIHSRWPNEAAFDLHATLPHTRSFLTAIEPLLTHARDITRTIRLG